MPSAAAQSAVTVRPLTAESDTVNVYAVVPGRLRCARRNRSTISTNSSLTIVPVPSPTSMVASDGEADSRGMSHRLRSARRRSRAP